MTGDITTNDSFAFGDDDGDDAFQNLYREVSE